MLFRKGLTPEIVKEFFRTTRVDASGDVYYVRGLNFTCGVLLMDVEVNPNKGDSYRAIFNFKEHQHDRPLTLVQDRVRQGVESSARNLMAQINFGAQKIVRVGRY